MWGETHSRSTNYRDTSAGFVSLFAAVGRGVLVLVVIAIVTATAMDTPALSHTHIAIWPYVYGNTSGKSEDPPPNVRIRGSSFFRYWCSYFPFFLCFRCLYILRDVRISLLLQRAGRKLQHIVALPSSLPPSFIYESVFHVVFPRFFPRFPGLVLLYILMCLLTVVE